MVYGFGRGFGRGLGFRGASPPWPYIGRGRGGLPRCWYPEAVMPGSVPHPIHGDVGIPPLYSGYPAWGTAPYSPQMTREQELDFLKEEADAAKGQLEEIEARIKELEATKE